MGVVTTEEAHEELALSLRSVEKNLYKLCGLIHSGTLDPPSAMRVCHAVSLAFNVLRTDLGEILPAAGIKNPCCYRGVRDVGPGCVPKPKISP